MKNLKLTSIIILLFMVILYACKKEDTAVTPTPIVVKPPVNTDNFTGCRIEKADFDASIYCNYTYGDDGFIKKIIYVFLGTTKSIVNEFSYTNGLLTGITEDGSPTEEYSYENGLLSKIHLLNVSDKDYRDYTIDIKMDANKRIIKMTDSKGFQSDLKRDEKGNLIELITTRVSDKREVYRFVNINFDGKKTAHELLKGWQFDVRISYTDYMQAPDFIIGGSGNPLKAKIYTNEILTFDADYEYTYNSQGYWTSIKFFENVSNRTSVVKSTVYLCK